MNPPGFPSRITRPPRLTGCMADGFEAIYQEYGRKIHGYLARLTGDPWAADELCQETFVRFLRHQHRLHVHNGTLGAWLFRVATNLFRDRLRRRRPVERLDGELTDGDAVDAVAARDLDTRVRAEVERLPPDLRATFLLRAHHELTYAKVAEALDVSERTAKQRFRHAREILAHRLRPVIESEQ